MRYDIFKQLFDIIEDDIDVRMLNNRQLEAIVELNRTKVASQVLMSNSASRVQMKGQFITGGNNSMNDTIVMKKGSLTTPGGGGGDFDKRKQLRSIKAMEIMGEGKTDKGSTPTPGKEKSAKKAFRVCS